MSSNTVNLTFNSKSGVAYLTFHRPKAMNAFNISMAGEFLATVRELQGLAGVRCVVLQGNARAFIAGGDVASMQGPPEKARHAVNGLLNALNPALIELRSLDAPIVAAVQGVAAGAGLSVSLMADLIVADAKATFLVAYDGIGAVPDCGASWALLHRIGAGKAAELMMLGTRLSGEEAYTWGLVNALSKEDDFDQVLTATVEKVASGPGKAYASFRKLQEKASGVTLADHLEAERQAFLDIVSTHDFQEGVQAFLEKRPAQFTSQ